MGFPDSVIEGFGIQGFRVRCRLMHIYCCLLVVLDPQQTLQRCRGSQEEEEEEPEGTTPASGGFALGFFGLFFFKRSFQGLWKGFTRNSALGFIVRFGLVFLWASKGMLLGSIFRFCFLWGFCEHSSQFFEKLTLRVSAVLLFRG